MDATLKNLEPSNNQSIITVRVAYKEDKDNSLYWTTLTVYRGGVRMSRQKTEERGDQLEAWADAEVAVGKLSEFFDSYEGLPVFVVREQSGKENGSADLIIPDKFYFALASKH